MSNNITTNARIAAILGSCAEQLAEAVTILLADDAEAAVTPKAGKRGGNKAAKGTKAQTTVAAEHGVEIVTSRAAGETLAANGGNPDMIMVPKGRFGREGHQTLTEARGKAVASEAQRAEFLAGRKAAAESGEKPSGKTAEQKAAAKVDNKALATEARENGVTPTGQAWAALKGGNRDWAALKAMNAADGIAVKPSAVKTEGAATPKATKAEKRAARKAATETTVIVAAEVDPQAQAKVAKLVAAGFTPEQAEEIVGKLVSA